MRHHLTSSASSPATCPNDTTVDGGLADRDAAIRFGRRARDSDRRDEEPAVDSALGSVLHDRFGAAGWLDDLDEVIARYREALTRQAATAPVYPAILNNLAIALQDRYLYHDDSGALDEAIGLHEQAVSACLPARAGPPRLPGHPGRRRPAPLRARWPGCGPRPGDQPRRAGARLPRSWRP